MSRVRIHPNPQKLGEYISIIAKVRHIVTMSATTTTVENDGIFGKRPHTDSPAPERVICWIELDVERER